MILRPCLKTCSSRREEALISLKPLKFEPAHVRCYEWIRILGHALKQILLFLALLYLAAPVLHSRATGAAQIESTNSNPGALVQLRGKVVCLPEEMHRLFQASLPSKHDHIYGFRA